MTTTTTNTPNRRALDYVHTGFECPCAGIEWTRQFDLPPVTIIRKGLA